MNEKINYKKIINKCLEKSVDFAEIFYENTIQNNIYLLSDKIDKIDTDIKEGIGIRLAKNDFQVYASTNILKDDEINNLVDNLLINFDDFKIIENVDYKEIEYPSVSGKNVDISMDEKVKLLHEINGYAKSKDKRITQVQLKLFEEIQKVEIVNSFGNITNDIRTRKRIDIQLYIKEKNRLEVASKRLASNSSYDYFLNIDYKSIIDELVLELYEKLNSVPLIGGKMPVIISNGFGGVIFHEACGHALEATTVSKNAGIFANKLGSVIASEKVTLIDDGSKYNQWGSTNIDDEGIQTKKNILIENGVLKSYLVDYLNSRKMKTNPTGSCRRESYLYSPTSRMNNTYLEKGTDKIEDMIKSIKYGLYAKRMGGGSVDPITGDFNFTVNHGYIIKDGQIKDVICDACLIGNGKDILKNVEMVSDDLKLTSGYCGAESGLVPTLVGQPTIKVSNITVSGVNNDEL